MILAPAPVNPPTMNGELMRRTPSGAPGQIERVGSVPANDLPPASAILRRYGRDILSLPGTMFTGWGIDKPTSLHVVTDSPEFAQVMRSLLRPTIDGISIDVRPVEAVRNARQGVEQLPWHENPSNMLRMLLSLPGVHDDAVSSTQMTITYYTTTAEQATKLSSLINDTVGGWTVRFKQGMRDRPDLAASR